MKQYFNVEALSGPSIHSCFFSGGVGGRGCRFVIIPGAPVSGTGGLKTARLNPKDLYGHMGPGFKADSIRT